jgi:hypothetical protein
VHTFIRVPAGAILAAGASAHFDPKIQLIAMLAAGGIALSSHGTKTATRLAANTSPEPFSNFLLSLLGDAIAFVGAVVMSVHPVVLLVIALCACVVSILLFRWIWRSLTKLFKPRSSAIAA